MKQPTNLVVRAWNQTINNKVIIITKLLWVKVAPFLSNGSLKDKMPVLHRIERRAYASHMHYELSTNGTIVYQIFLHNRSTKAFIPEFNEIDGVEGLSNHYLTYQTILASVGFLVFSIEFDF